MNNEELFEQFEEALRKGFKNRVTELLINRNYDWLDAVFKKYDMDFKQFIGEGLSYSGTREEFYKFFILKCNDQLITERIAQHACDDIPSWVIEQTQDRMLKELKTEKASTEQLEDGSIF